MTPKLSILIPTMPGRERFFDRLMSELNRQIHPGGKRYDVEIVYSIGDKSVSVGKRRNELMDLAKGEYICFIDDDDRIADNYIDLVMTGIATSPDCCSLNGIIITDGKDPKPFIHSIDYNEFFERDGIYYRCPNHLNTIRTELARQCPFPDWQRSEDSNFAFQLRDKGLLKVEYKIPETLYFYDFISDKRY